MRSILSPNFADHELPHFSLTIPSTEPMCEANSLLTSVLPRTFVKNRPSIAALMMVTFLMYSGSFRDSSRLTSYAKSQLTILLLVWLNEGNRQGGAKKPI